MRTRSEARAAIYNTTNHGGAADKDTVVNRDGITTGPGGGSPFFIGQITSAQHTTDGAAIRLTISPGALPSWAPAPAICSSYQQAETISSRADVLAAI